MSFDVQVVNSQLTDAVVAEINQKTKPPGALGKLEQLALQIALIQNTAQKQLTMNKPHVLVFAADHGIAEHGISIAGSEVTAQMVNNFLAGGAAINALSRANQCQMKVIDSGVKHAISGISSKEVELLRFSAGDGTADFSQQPAMTPQQLVQCMQSGEAVIAMHVPSDCDVIAFGEMGIGNTASAAALLALLCDLSAEVVTGKGTGISNEQMQYKVALIQKAIQRVKPLLIAKPDPMRVLQQVGGFEIAQICSAMLAAAKRRKIILVDGFIVTAAAMIAVALQPNVKDYMIFAHCSDEQAHKSMHKILKVEPLLNLGMRLGEGTGAVLALSLLRSAIAFYNQMATFDSAGVTV